jgi:hypothetical protein
LWVRNIIPNHYRFSCDLTNSWHLYYCLILILKAGAKKPFFS